MFNVTLEWNYCLLLLLNMNNLPKPAQDLMNRGKDVNRKLREQANKLRSKWRKVVTGDEKKRIRDHIRETEEQPKYIKLFDKIQFTLGVLNICACQFFLLNRPEFFWLWYAGVIPVMMFSRFYHFRCLGFQYFMIDFCYFSVFLSLLNVFFFQHSALFFKVCFIFANGPLPIAILIWRNSFIFHDFDKIVSVYIHFLPSMLYYTLRWHTVWQSGVESDQFGSPTVACYMATCEPLTLYDYCIALGFYLFWQVMYMLKTEVWDKKKLDSNPELITSLRWMSSDTKNALARIILKSLRKMRVFGKQEEFNSASMKTKMVFVVSQLLVTFVGFLPTPLFYHSSLCHLLWIVLIFISSIYNGASFYIEVFSKRYNQKIAKIEEMHKFAKEAEVVMSEIAAIKKSNSQVLNLEEPKNAGKEAAVVNGEKNEIENSTEAKTLEKQKQHPSTDSLDSISRGLQQTSEEAWAAIRENADDLHYLMSGGDHNPLGNKSYNYAGYPLADRSISLDSAAAGSEEGGGGGRESFDSDAGGAIAAAGGVAHYGADSRGLVNRRSHSSEGERTNILKALRKEVWLNSSQSDTELTTSGGKSATLGIAVEDGSEVLSEGETVRERAVSDAIPIDE